MKRRATSYSITDFNKLKSQLLNFGKRFSNFCFLDNHNYNFDKSYECIAGLGNTSSISSEDGKKLKDIDQFKKENPDWIFGHLSFDLKNEIEDLSSQNEDHIGFENFFFFVPEILIILSNQTVTIAVDEKEDSENILNQILAARENETILANPILKSRITKTAYLETVKKLQQHILRGDCYEICFCQEFYADETRIDPIRVFEKLSAASPNPFSAFYRLDEKYLICASPERFLKKVGDTIFSQPIKGTTKRSKIADESEKLQLRTNQKEVAENVMIVDLVRNDLSKICEEGTVKVKELFEVYSFPQVHQMISSIEGKLLENVPFSKILKATFPMGSMTGAPKKRVLELIEKYEQTKRGLFSGSVGYISPGGDFDFNVVIRSILYNAVNKYLSVPVGSAITWKSNPEKEFEECENKIEGIIKALE